MAINVVHVVTDLSKINFGIWNAAVFGSSYLRLNHEVKSVLLVCQNREDHLPTLDLPIIFAGSAPSIKNILRELKEQSFHSSNTLAVTHGCWKLPTRVGYQLKKHGFKWIYVPHGMLEPWSLANHRLKKILYFQMFEKRFLKKSDAIRAVSAIEKINLEEFLKRKAFTVENGIKMPAKVIKETDSISFLFMARLHFKKGILPLVKAWSRVMGSSRARLIIAGPDEGELNKIRPYLNDQLEYIGAVYGEEKVALLKRCHYYLLPSLSEGFPTSVVEAMGYGMIPLISKGCNFPQVFEEELGYCIEPDEKNIEQQLLSLKDIEFDHDRSQRNHEYIGKYYSEDAIGGKLFKVYTQLLHS